MAQAFNILVADGGGWPHHNMHLRAAVSHSWRVEFHYLMWKVEETIYKNPPKPEKGVVTLTEEPGYRSPENHWWEGDLPPATRARL